MDDDGKMTGADRESLLRVARLTERVAKSGLPEAGTHLLVDLDKQLDASYPFNLDKIWKEAYQAARDAAKEADAKVKARCRELGIPDRFAPCRYSLARSRRANTQGAAQRVAANGP